MTTATIRRPRKVNPVRLDEATILSRPVCPCEMLPAGLPGLVTINGQAYMIEFNATLPDQGEPVVYGYRLTNEDNGKEYDIDTTTTCPTCDCSDALYRDRACKHVLALRQLTSEGSL